MLIVGGDRRVLPLADLLTIPLPDKIRHILERTVEFCLGRTPIDRRIALAGLREAMRE